MKAHIVTSAIVTKITGKKGLISHDSVDSVTKVDFLLFSFHFQNWYHHRYLLPPLPPLIHGSTEWLYQGCINESLSSEQKWRRVKKLEWKSYFYSESKGKIRKKWNKRAKNIHFQYCSLSLGSICSIVDRLQLSFFTLTP